MTHPAKEVIKKSSAALLRAPLPRFQLVRTICATFRPKRVIIPGQNLNHKRALKLRPREYCFTMEENKKNSERFDMTPHLMNFYIISSLLLVHPLKGLLVVLAHHPLVWLPRSLAAARFLLGSFCSFFPFP